MKTNKNFIFRSIAGEYVLIPTGEASQQFNGMIELTETAAFIWKKINTAKDPEEIIQSMLEEFDVDEETARTDVYGFLGALYEHGLVSDIPEFDKER